MEAEKILNSYRSQNKTHINYVLSTKSHIFQMRMQISRQLFTTLAHETIGRKPNLILNDKCREDPMTQGEGGTAPNHLYPRHWKGLAANTTSGHFSSRRRPGTSRTGGWANFRTSLDGTENIFPNRGSITRSSSP